MCHISRRGLMKSTAGAVTFSILPLGSKSAWAEVSPGKPPRFFLSLVVSGGLDPSYMFDARPMSLTNAALKTNYLNEEPSDWQGSNGIKTLVTSLVKPLEIYKNDFSILNGVHMASTFDGHDQNMNQLLTGNPFGGESFVPHLNVGKMPIDALEMGFLFAEVSNKGNSIPLTFGSARNLFQRIEKMQTIQYEKPVMSFIKKRYEVLSQGKGKFARGTADLNRGFDKVGPLAEKLKGVGMGSENDGAGNSPGGNNPLNELKERLQLVASLFKQQVAASAVISLSTNQTVDVHSPDSAAQQPQLIKEVVGQIGEVFRFLKETPYDDGHSLWDLTTVMFTSEFGRTMRQEGLAMDKSGTDHNPLTNTVLIGGRGIKGGMVVGASDIHSPEENLSKAHLSLDPSKIKMMGRPFDFANLTPRSDLPEEFKVNDYLSINNVANTIYKIFDVPESTYRISERNGPKSAILSGLLA